MDIKQIADECGLIHMSGYVTVKYIGMEELELFAQKIKAARDAEWMAEPVGYVRKCEYYTGSVISNDSNYYGGYSVPIYIQPKEVK